MFIKADKHLRAYYNEIDPFAAAWLRELAANGFITNGDIDERSIVDVRPSDLAGYDRVHLFAGIGVWDFALNQAHWGRRGIWTASCPCQPFSAAGAGAGFADERHLWPHAHWLIGQCRPPVIVGEQVASKDADAWIDLVQADLEAVDYAFGTIPFPSASVGAPHIRDRNYWMAYADDHQSRSGRDGGSTLCEGLWAEPSRRGAVGLLEYAEGDGRQQWRPEPGGRGAAGGCGAGRLDDDDAGLEGQRGRHQAAPGHGPGPARPASETGQSGGLADDDDRAGPQQGQRYDTRARHGHSVAAARVNDRPGTPGPTNGFWRDADWLFCRDGKWRPVEPGTFPLAHGAPARVGRLRGYGNAINAIQAQIFIETVIETLYPEIENRPDDAIRLTGLSVSTNDMDIFA